ncbi:MAG: hypothetical protein KBC41_00720 [Candidatus Pacebacteria bacterium]|nr:hypothetical protein [Candidatus Paceibacterota bacterium]MBP9866586.1 hypothetical protein [Candidatus Paceibacterota bacterium]
MKELNKEEKQFLKSLNTPHKIQDFLDSISFNLEENGETCMSPKRVLKEKKAHCIEAALLAGVCLWLNKKQPLIVSLKVKLSDYDHIIVLYKENGYYGAISKTNHNVLRFRDPVYKNVRELVMSYFHEYFLVDTGEKTLLGYTKPINIKKFGTKWIEREDNLWDIAENIYDTPVIEIVPKENKKKLRLAHELEQDAAKIAEWTTPTQ